MNYTDLEQGLMDAMSRWQIIDCHEHLSPEAERTGKQVDVFTLFSHYTHGDLLTAGMTELEYQSLFNRDVPLETRWKTFAPHWENIRYTSYSRSVLITARKFYGIDDLTADTCRPLSQRIQAANTPGLYTRVLRDACGIRLALTQCGRTQLNSDLLVPLMPLIYEQELGKRNTLTHPSFEAGAEIRSLDDYLAAVQRYVVRMKAEGAVGLKWIARPCPPPSRPDADAAFRSVMDGKELETTWWPEFPHLNPLATYVADWAIKVATEHDLVIAIHTGYWGDFRKLNPVHIIPFLQGHPKARFDIYHLGYPWLREAIMLGKGFPNVWLNLCWTHIISQKFAMDGVDEIIDTVPANKVLAFGGDYGDPVEKIYGHLTMAREDMARVFARRISEGRMTEAQALNMAHKWFWENPRELYRLKV